MYLNKHRLYTRKVIIVKERISKLCPVLNSKIMAQSREEVPVIVQFNEGEGNLKNNIKALSSRINSNLPLIDGFAGFMSTETIYRFMNSSEIKYISFDSKVYTLLDVASPSMETYLPHDKGYEGEGITIGVIDTGVAPHRDLTKPENRIIGFKDFINKRDEAYDDNGHGTHVAGIIAGNGYSSKERYVGIAPKANILAIKAMDEDGGGSTSEIIEAIAYAVATKDKYNTKILNLSVGTPATNNCDRDPLCRAVQKAIEAGLIVVVAAGNSGPDRETILSPGINPSAITVGAVDDKRTIDISDDKIAEFSSRGPTSDGRIKPDLVAPGVSINSLSNINLEDYAPLSGTSMATPMVSGSIALLLNKYGDKSPKKVKDMLIDSCIDLKNSKEIQGAGLLNLKLLFKEQEDKDGQGENLKGNSKETSKSQREFMDTLIIAGVLIFLLDSRI